MKKINLILILTILCGLLSNVQAQDQARIVYYNTLNFPGTTPERADTLRKIVQYAQPDLLLVNELQSNTGANLILNNSLNQFGINYYQKAAFVNGSDTDNMLFYNSNKFGLISQSEITTVLRDINEYVLYYKDPNISATSDTIYFYMYSVHLKAGSTTDNESQRNVEITALINYLNAKGYLENVFVGGDFNFYSNTEAGFQTIYNNTTVEFNDPANAVGDWHTNYNYRNYHTQSTRDTDLGDDGAWGGMDDRFDFIFTTNDVLNGSKGVKYVADSYQALGQDGLRYNDAINNPANTLVPDSVATALLYMSDHLPVLMDVEIDYLTNSVTEYNLTHLKVYYNAISNQLILNKSIEVTDFKLYSLTGQLVYHYNQTGVTNAIDLNLTLSSGIYVYSLETKNGNIRQKISVQ